MANIEFLSGVSALGFTYHSCPYWRRVDGRSSIHISIWWTKLIIYLPFQHVTPFGHGSATSYYGFYWWPRLNIRPHFYWETLK